MAELLSIDDCERLSVDQVWDLYRRYVNPGQVNIFSTFAFGRELFTDAEGMYLNTADGRRILDFTGGLGVLSHGHNHPRILKARTDYQRRKRMEVHKIVFSPYIAALSHNVAELLPGDLNKCFFPNSGAEAVEGALKAAYKSRTPRRDFVLHADISFHGKLIGSGTISGSQTGVFDFPKMANTATFAYDDLDSVRARVDGLRRPDGTSNVYAIIVEPFSATTLTGCSRAFLEGVREICDREGIALIFDEVYTGWGKTGTLFAFMRHGVMPDILAMSKSFGGGKSSISGLVVRDGVFDTAYGTDDDALLHTSTYNGFGEECVTALEAVNIAVEDDYPGRAERIHERLVGGLSALQKDFPGDIGEIRGQGALVGLVLNSPFELVEKALAAIPVGPLKNKRSFIRKLTAAALMDDLYAREGVLTMMIENGDFVALTAAPSLIAEDADIDRFLHSVRASLDRGLGKLVSTFVATKLKMMLGLT